MGLFNRKKEKVEKLLTYGQRGLDNGDVFPSTYFLEEFFMSDREMEARYPKRFDCQIDSWNASFIRIGSSSYEATMLWSDRTWKKSIIVKHLIPMTPIGTTLHNGGIYVLLSKDSYDWGRTEYQDDGSERVTYDRLYVIDRSTYDMKLNNCHVNSVLKDMGYYFISI